MASVRLKRILGLNDGDLPQVAERTLESMSDVELISVTEVVARAQAEMKAAADRGEWSVELELPRYEKLEDGTPAEGFVPERVLVAAVSLMGYLMNAPHTMISFGSAEASRGGDDLSWYVRLSWGMVEVDDYEATRRVIPVDLVLRMASDGQFVSCHTEVEGREVSIGAWSPAVVLPGGLQQQEQRLPLKVVVPHSWRLR